MGNFIICCIIALMWVVSFMLWRAICAEAKVRYKDGQLQIKDKAGDWCCYDMVTVRQIAERVNPIIDGARDTKADLLAKIHANHKPTWKYMQNHEKPKGSSINMIEQLLRGNQFAQPAPQLHSGEFSFKCTKCGFVKHFTEKELTPGMKLGLIQLGLFDKQ